MFSANDSVSSNVDSAAVQRAALSERNALLVPRVRLPSRHSSRVGHHLPGQRGAKLRKRFVMTYRIRRKFGSELGRQAFLDSLIKQLNELDVAQFGLVARFCLL